MRSTPSERAACVDSWSAFACKTSLPIAEVSVLSLLREHLYQHLDIAASAYAQGSPGVNDAWASHHFWGWADPNRFRTPFAAAGWRQPEGGNTYRWSNKADLEPFQERGSDIRPLRGKVDEQQLQNPLGSSSLPPAEGVPAGGESSFGHRQDQLPHQLRDQVLIRIASCRSLSVCGLAVVEQLLVPLMGIKTCTRGADFGAVWQVESPQWQGQA